MCADVRVSAWKKKIETTCTNCSEKDKASPIDAAPEERISDHGLPMDAGRQVWPHNVSNSEVGCLETRQRKRIRSKANEQKSKGHRV